MLPTLKNETRVGDTDGEHNNPVRALDTEENSELKRIILGAMNKDHNLKLGGEGLQLLLNVELTVNSSPLNNPAEKTTIRSSGKGKEKIMGNYAFNNNGMLSAEAINIMDAGLLVPISKVFQNPVLDLDKKVFKGIFVKDILDSAVKGTLPLLISTIQPQQVGKGELKIFKNEVVDAMVGLSYLRTSWTWKRSS